MSESPQVPTDPAAYAAYYAAYYSSQGANAGAAYAAQVKSGEGYTYSYAVTGDVAPAATGKKPGAQPRTIKSAHAGYIDAINRKAANSSSAAPQQVMVHITGLNGSVTKAQVEATFGKAGMIKIRKKTKEPNVWVGPDGTEGSVTYDDPSSAQLAVSMFDGKDAFATGTPLHVKLYSFDHEEAHQGRGRGGGGRGGGGYGGGYGSRDGGGGRGAPPAGDGDWNCPMCGNMNFARRMQCNKCGVPKPDGGGGGGGGMKRDRSPPRGGGGGGGGRDRSPPRDADKRNRY